MSFFRRIMLGSNFEIKETQRIYYTASEKIVPAKGALSIISNDWDSSTKEGVITCAIDITHIGERAFEKCASLTSITIPQSVIDIGSYAFLGCTGLMKVHIVNIDAWCRINFHGAFSNPLYYGGGLYLDGNLVESVVIPDDVTDISNVFYNCTSLETVTIPSGITSIGSSAFYGCSSLTDINLPDSITEIGHSAFYNCASLANITIPSGVINMSIAAFYGCSSLTKINIPDGVIRIEDNILENCTKLSSLTIGTGVTTIRNEAFKNCISLTSLKIPKSVNYIYESAFSGCDALQYCDFSQHTTIPKLENNTVNNYITSGCKIIVPDNLYNDWKVYSSWYKHAGKIVKTSEYTGS